MRLKLFPKPRIFGNPRSCEEAVQITSEPELNTIIKWLCKIEGFHKSGNPLKGFFFIQPDQPLFDQIECLERNGWTINKATFRPITLKDLQNA